VLLILWNEPSADRFKWKNSRCWTRSFFGYVLDGYTFLMIWSEEGRRSLFGMMRNGFRTDIQARMISRICTVASTLNDADNKISFLKICNGFERGIDFFLSRKIFFRFSCLFEHCSDS
jgi:hypothetical protein